MTIISSLLPYLQFRRPSLRRQSAFTPLYHAINDFIKRIYKYHIDQYITVLETNAVTYSQYTKNKFSFDVEDEIGKIRPTVKIIMDALLESNWQHLVSGKTPSSLLQNAELQKTLNNTILGLTLKSWLEQPLQELYEHLVNDCRNLLPHIIPPPFVKDIKRLIKRLPEYLTQSDTLEGFLELVYKYIHYLPFKDSLRQYIHKQIYLQKDIEPDLYYSRLRSLFVLPSSLLQCIREELRCQQVLDDLEFKLHLHKQKKYKDTASKSQTYKFDYNAYKQAKFELEKAEDRTAKLVKWYECWDKVAKRRGAYEKTMIGTKRKVHNVHKQIRKLIGKKEYNAEQLEAITKLNEARQYKLSKDPIYSLNYEARKKIDDVSIMMFSPLQIIFAILSPLHVFHKEWTNELEFVALTHHLQMLNLFPAALAHIPNDSKDFRYVRHIRGIPFTDIDVVKNQQQCMKETNDYREVWCKLAIGLKDQMYPQEILLEEKNCYDPKMLYIAQKHAERAYKQVEADAAEHLKTHHSHKKHRKKHHTSKHHTSSSSCIKSVPKTSTSSRQSTSSHKHSSSSHKHSSSSHKHRSSSHKHRSSSHKHRSSSPRQKSSV